MAPSSVSSGPIHAIMAMATRADASVISRTPEPPSRRARARSPEPSARATTAETAIIMPIFTEVDRKNTVVAKPTPAVTFTWPSHEM